MHNHHLAQPAAWDWADIHATCLSETHRWLGVGPGAEDAAQEAALRAWRRQATCHSPDQPGAWVRRIARNEALRMHEGPRADAIALEDVAGQLPAEEPRPRLPGELTKGIRRLKDRDRLVVFLRYWADLTQPEIASVTDMPEGTVKIALHRARAALRVAVAD